MIKLSNLVKEISLGGEETPVYVIIDSIRTPIGQSYLNIYKFSYNEIDHNYSSLSHAMGMFALDIIMNFPEDSLPKSKSENIPLWKIDKENIKLLNIKEDLLFEVTYTPTQQSALPQIQNIEFPVNKYVNWKFLCLCTTKDSYEELFDFYMKSVRKTIK